MRTYRRRVTRGIADIMSGCTYSLGSESSLLLPAHTQLVRVNLFRAHFILRPMSAQAVRTLVVAPHAAKDTLQVDRSVGLTEDGLGVDNTLPLERALEVLLACPFLHLLFLLIALTLIAARLWIAVKATASERAKQTADMIVRTNSP